MKRRRYRGKNENTIRKQMVWLAAALASVCILIMMSLTICQVAKLHVKGKKAKKAAQQKEVTATPLVTVTPTETPSVTPIPTSNPENRIYSYLQGPKSWNRRLDWSGEWGETALDGGYFGGFGCGLCCLANIYSSETPYQCSPLDMYGYVKKHTGYSGGMAIEWGYMRRTLSSLGFECEVVKKPSDYKKFVSDIRKCESCIALISSQDSTVYWKNTPGHYVTLFQYDEKTQTVFLADSGDPDHNRQRISLKKIYRSLKSASNWQYLVVGEYHVKKDHWKQKETEGSWVKPEYLLKPS